METSHVRELLTEPVYERAILSHIINNSTNYYTTLSKLSTSDFLHPKHAIIFGTLGKLINEGVKEFDIPILATELEKNGDLNSAGGLDYLESISRFRLSNSNLDLALSKVVDSSTKYKLYQSLNNFQAEIVANSSSSEDLVGAIENTVLDLSSSKVNSSEPINITTGLLEFLEERRHNKIEMSGLSTGYPILDNQIDGMIPGTLFIVAARKKAGKSALLTNIALNTAFNHKCPVLYVDTELSFREWRTRVLASITGVNERVIKHGGYSDDVYRVLIEKGYAKLEKHKIFHEYMPGFTVDKITAVFKKFKFKEDIGFGVFDYIKEPDSSSISRNRKEHQILGDVTTKLKDLSGQLDIPFAAAVQLNRENDVADSDRVARYGDIVAFWQVRTKKEFEEEKEKNIPCRGTHRLIIKDTRRGGSTPEEGITYFFNKKCISIKEVPITRQLAEYGTEVHDEADADGYDDAETLL